MNIYCRSCLDNFSITYINVENNKITENGIYTKQYSKVDMNKDKTMIMSAFQYFKIMEPKIPFHTF